MSALDSARFLASVIEEGKTDKDARIALLNDPAYCERFRKMWYQDKKGFSLARIKRWLRIMDDSLSRDLADMVMTARPLPVWARKSDR